MATLRSEKLSAEFQKSIYEILTKKVKDPRLTEMFTITSVEVDKEMTYAKVNISIFSTNEAKAYNTFEAIKSSSRFVRQQLFKSMRIRVVPEIAFFIDKGMENTQRINEILDQIKKENKDEE